AEGQKQLELTSELIKDSAIVFLVFLERHGFVNFGVFERLERPLTWLGNDGDKQPFRVLVIGAGIAGLAPLDNFEYFGCQKRAVALAVEFALFRKKAPYIGDLGAMVITGLGGNPLTIDIELFKLKPSARCLTDTGVLIDSERDAVIEREFNRVVLKRLPGRPDCEKMSLGQAVDLLVQMQEQRCREQQLVHLQKMLDLQPKPKIARRHAAWLAQDAAAGGDSASSGCRCRRAASASSDSSNAFLQLFDRRAAEFQRLKAKGEELQDSLDALDAEPPSGVYLGRQTRTYSIGTRLIWNFANAAPLDKLSLRHWDQDDENEFSGPHLTVRNGYSCLPLALAEGLNDLRLDTSVQRIEWDAEGATIRPLNELTRPPLPEWKIDSINRLGYGVLNKVLLAFDKYFWDPQLNLFGYVPNSVDGRGEFFLFWSVYKAPVLLALVSGESAELIEKACRRSHSGARPCLSWAKIFGSAPNAQALGGHPLWRSDPYSRGSYSYVAPGRADADAGAAVARLPARLLYRWRAHQPAVSGHRAWRFVKRISRGWPTVRSVRNSFAAGKTVARLELGLLLLLLLLVPKAP
uniref:Amino_oxidase domain-containing protein n=1 Tax=Macrostomum lignano TaxID=282301 RepID=A0A1I8F7K7_9PLAT